MNIVIIGQGAIGLLWYYNLIQQSGNNVSLQCSKTVNKIPNNMLFTDIEGQSHRQLITPSTTKDFAQADVVLFCLKAL